MIPENTYEAHEMGDGLDLRTYEEMAAADRHETESARETLTGLPARPGTIR